MAFPTESEWLQSINRVKSYVNLSDEPDNLVMLATMLLNTNATSNLNPSTLGQTYPGDIAQTVYLDAANNFTPVLYSRKYNLDTLVYDVNELTLIGIAYNPANTPVYILHNAPGAPVSQSFNIVETYYDAAVTTSEFSIRDELAKLTVYINSVPQPPIWVNNTTGLTLTTNPLLPSQALPALDTSDSLLTFIKLYTEQSKLNLVDVVANTNLANTFLSTIEQLNQDLLAELLNLKSITSNSAATLVDIKTKNAAIETKLDTVVTNLFTLFAIETGVGTLVSKLTAVETYLTTTQNTKITSIDTKLTNINTALISGINGLKVDGSAVTQPVTVSSLPLPIGAATQLTATELNNNLELVSAKLTNLNTNVTNLQTNVVALPTVLALESGHIASVDAKLITTTAGLKVDGSAVVQPISVNTLPLPLGAATALKQDTANLKLDNLTLKDFATENTLVSTANSAHIDALVIKDAVETVSSQLTVSNNRLTEIKNTAELISNKDFATAANQATEVNALVSINTSIDTKSNSIITNQNIIVTKLTAIDNDTVAIGTQVVTTNNLLTAISSRDFASETSLSAIKDAILSNVNLSETTWTDDSGTFFLREVTQDQQTQAKIITFTLLNGTLYTPGANPRPADKTLVIDQPLTDTQLRVNPLAVSGNFYLATQPISAVSLPLPTGAANTALQIDTNTLLTEVSIAQTSVNNKLTDTNSKIASVVSNTTATNLKLDTVNTELTNLAAKIPTNLTVTTNKLLVDGSGVTQPVSQAGTWNVTTNQAQPLTDTQLRSNPVNTNVVNTVAVSGTFYPTIQAVSVSSLPLPTGAASSIYQLTNIDLLTDVRTNLTALNLEVANINSGALSNLNTASTTTVNRLTSLDSKATDSLSYLNILNSKLPNIVNNRIVVDGSGVTQPISGTVNTGLVQPLTNTQLRAAALPVTVTNFNDLPVTIDGLLENKLGVCSIYVISEGSGYVNNDPVIFNGGTAIIPAEGTLVVNQGKVLGVKIINQGYYSVLPTSLTANTGTGLSVTLITGNTISLQLFDNPYVRGLITGAANDTVYFEVSTNGYTWLSTSVNDVNNLTLITQVNSFPCLFNANATGALYFRLRRANLNVSPAQSNLVYLSATEGSFINASTSNGLTDTQLRATPLPVVISTLPNVTITNFPATQPISAVTLPLPAGAATETTLANVNSKVPALGQALAANSIPVVLTAAQLTTLTPLSSVNITGTLPTFASPPTVNIGTAPTLNVIGTFFQATQPVSLVSVPLATNAAIDRVTVVAPYSNRLSDGTSFYDARQIRALTSADTVTIASSVLPTGAATSANQSTTNTNLGTIVTNTTNIATSALQTSGNLSLLTIATNTPALGQALATGSSPVVLPAAQIAALTPLSTVAVTQSGSWTVNTGLSQSLTDVQLRATAVAVSGTFFQAIQPVSATALPLPTGAATSSNQATTNASIASIDTKTPALGQALAISSSPVVLTAAQLTTLTPLSSVSLSGTLPAFTTTPTVNVGTMPTVAVTGTFFQATQPVSLLSIPLATNAATDRITSVSPYSNRLSDGTSFYDARQIRALTSADTFTIATGSNVIGSISNTAFALNGTLPSYAVTPTFNIGTTNGLALDVTNTNGNQITQIKSGAKGTSTSQLITSTASGVDRQPLDVIIYDGAGNTITTFGTATSTLQTTGNNSLSSIDSKTPAIGQALVGASSPVVLPASQITTLTPPAAITGFNLEATQLLIKAKTDNIPIQGQALAAASLPVVLPAAQITALTPPAQITGFALAANQQTNAITDVQIRATALPVSLSSTTISNFPATQTVSGTVTSNIGTTNGLALDATQTNGTQKSIVRGGTKGTSVAADVTSTVVDVNTQALDVSIKGTSTVSVNNFPSSQAVTGTFFQATQPISGTVTANTGLTQPLTDTQIRLTPLPISGTVSTGGITDTQIRATPLPISGTVVTGGLTDTQLRAIALPISGNVTANIGTTNGLALDTTLTGGNLKAILRTAAKGTTIAGDTTSTAVDANTQALDVSVKGTVATTLSGTPSVAISNFPATQAVTGTFFQTTQPVSLASTTVSNTVAISATALPLPTGAAIAANQQTNAITDLQIRATPLPISGTVATGGITDTQIRATALPVSGTIIANIGTVNGIALDTSVNSLLKPASTLAAVTSITNTVTIKADTLLNQTTALKVDGTATTQPISVTTLPLPSGASTSALQGTTNSSLGSIDTKLPTGLTVTLNRLQVELPAGGTGLTNTEIRATALPVSVASLPLPSGAATETTLGALNTKIPSGLVVTTGRLQVELPAGGTGLTNTEIRATPLPVSGTVAANATLSAETTKVIGTVNVAGTVSVSGTFFQTTQPVSAVSLPLPTGAATSANQQTNAITDAQIRAIPLPVSSPVLSSTGSLTVAAQAVTLALGGGYANTTFQVSGTYVGTLVFEASNDNTNWTTINALRAGDNTISQQISDTATNDVYRCTTAGFGFARLRANVLTSGTAVVTALATESTSGVFLNFPVPPGANTIGAVNVNGTVPVSVATDADTTATGTLAAAAQTVILSMGGKSAASVQISGTWAGTITFEGSVDGITFNSINAVAASTSQPQPTTTVNGLYRLSPAGLFQIRAIMTAFTAGSGSASISMRASAGTGGVFANQILPSKITDGTNTVTIKPASIAPTTTDQAAVVSLSPNGNQGTSANQLTLINKFQTGSQDTLAALAVTQARKTTVIGFTTTTTNLNSNLLDPSGVGNWTDVRDFNSCCIVLNVSGTVQYSIQGWHTAPSTIGVNLDVYNISGTIDTGINTTSGTGLIRLYVPLIECNYLRVVTEAGTTIGVSAILYATSALFIPPKNTVRLAANTGVAANYNTLISDIFSSNITTTTTTASITPDRGTSFQVSMNVFTVTGTAPTLSVQVQESIDNGSNWRTTYTFPTITVAGTYISPMLPVTGTNIRYVQTVTGTTPVFNRSILRLQSSLSCNIAIAPRRSGAFNLANGGLDLVAQGRVRRVIANNRTATQMFLQIHDSAVALVTGAVPSGGEVYSLNASGGVILTEFGEFGTTLGANPRIAISSTFATYTLPAALAVSTVSLFIEAL